MDMRRVKAIALCCGLTAAMLASEDVRPALATPTSHESNLEMNFWLKSKKALGGGEKFYDRIGADNYNAVWDCSHSAACRANFGKKIGPEDLKNVRSILEALETGIRE